MRATVCSGGTRRGLIAEKSITDIVLYGDTRPIHAQAVEIARAAGLTVHVFEEGYMRPYWVTYERGGTNGNSRLMEMSVPEMRAALAQSDMDTAMPPASWGDMRQHIFYGALYHGCVLVLNQRYRGFRPHRALSVGQEFSLYLKRLLLMPVQAIERRTAAPSPCDKGASAGGRAFPNSRNAAPSGPRAWAARTRALPTWRQAGAAAGRGALGGHGQFHRRATGALARHSAAHIRAGRLCQAASRLDQALARFLRRGRAPGPERLCRLPSLSAGNQPGRGWLLFRTRAQAGPATGGRHDACTG